MTVTSAVSPSRPLGQRAAIRTWLRDKHFTHFVTLATNDPMVSKARMRELLKAWDARVNRKIVGPK